MWLEWVWITFPKRLGALGNNINCSLEGIEDEIAECGKQERDERVKKSKVWCWI
jgi:hypothetical protein